MERVQGVLLRGYHGAPTSGTVTIREFNRDERVRRALAGLGKWWGVAIVSVFIPVAHFVLVPSFLAYGGGRFFPPLPPPCRAPLCAPPDARCGDAPAAPALRRGRAPAPAKLPAARLRLPA